MAHCDTKATPFQCIDDNILKSSTTGLTNHTQPISHHITPLVINALGGGTHTQAHIPRHANENNFKKPGTCGLWLRAPGLQISKYEGENFDDLPNNSPNCQQLSTNGF